MLQSKPQPPPDTRDDFCQVCGATAPFLERELATGKVERFCRDHLPDSFNWIPKSLARLMEEAYLAERVTNESSPPVVAG